MRNKISEQHSPSSEDLRRVFENAVGQVHQTVPAIQVAPRHTPIVQRGEIASSPQSGSKSGIEKRLSDAARALARLWKVSPHPAR